MNYSHYYGTVSGSLGSGGSGSMRGEGSFLAPAAPPGAIMPSSSSNMQLDAGMLEALGSGVRQMSIDEGPL